MKVRTEQTEIDLQLEFQGLIPISIESDSLRLRQVLINLLGNAIKFTQKGEVRLVVSFDPSSELLSFEVRDTGIGMTDEQARRLFQPFSQVDQSASRQFGGTGLGLAISKRLTQMLGGDISVESRVGHGSVFRVSIAARSCGPCQTFQADSDPDSQLTFDVGQTAQQQPTLSGHILLAEDGPDNRRLISYLLKKAGVQVTVVENGKEAVEILLGSLEDAAPFQAVLMDMQMPILDGYGATKKLRAAGCELPIIALTAHAMSGDREKCQAAGCDDYLTKPVDREKLISTLAKILGPTS